MKTNFLSPVSLQARCINFFKIRERKSAISIEIFAGMTTFMTMSYIIFVQPSIMSGAYFTPPIETGMPYGALLTGTCIAAAFGSILMGILANYPVALAPGMGENFFFLLTVLPLCAGSAVAGAANGWRTALGVVLLSGCIFLLLSLLNIRKLLLSAISPSLQKAIAGGIGLFIALIGLQNSGIIECKNGHFILSSNLKQISFLIFFIGLTASVAMQMFRIRGAILFGIIISALTAAVLGKINLFIWPMGLPVSPAPVFAKADFSSVFSHFFVLLPFIMIFAFMDIFDTLGTLIGVGTQAGMIKNNELPDSKKAFASDALATVFGAFCGHSTVTSYIESSAGIEYGGRTGLTAVVAGLCFLLALFFSPFIAAVAGCPVITAPALLIVGATMMKNIKDIKWDDYSESLPSFLIFIGIPFTYSIADGLTLGFIAYPLIKLACRREKETGWLIYALGIVLIFYIMFIRKFSSPNFAP